MSNNQPHKQPHKQPYNNPNKILETETRTPATSTAITSTSTRTTTTTVLAVASGTTSTNSTCGMVGGGGVGGDSYVKGLFAANYQLLRNGGASHSAAAESSSSSAALTQQASAQASTSLSSSGFDVVGALVSMATRPNPKIQLGPIDLACAFVISDLRAADQPIVYVSPTFEAMTGFSNQEIIGRNCRFLQHPTQDIQQGSPRLYTDHSVVARIKTMITNREEGQFTIINYKKNGLPFLNHVTMIPLCLGANKTEVTHYIGLQIDLISISQPKAIMQKLQNGTYSVNYQQDQSALASPEIDDSLLDSFVNPLEIVTNNSAFGLGAAKLPLHSLLSIMEKVPDFVFVLSLRGLFLYISPESCKKLLEWDSEELLGRKISDYVHPSDLVTVMRDLKNCSAEGNMNFICRMKRKNSGYMYIEMNGHVYNGSKRNRCFIISGREKPLLVLPQNTFYRPEAETDNETWLRTSPQGLILYCTSSAAACFHHHATAIPGISLYEWIEQPQHPSLTKALSSEMCETVQFSMRTQSDVFVYIFRFLHLMDTSGGTRWIQVKRDRKDLNTHILKSEANLYYVIQSARSSSINYECNKIRVRNGKLLEEIEKLSRV